MKDEQTKQQELDADLQETRRLMREHFARKRPFDTISGRGKDYQKNKKRNKIAKASRKKNR